MKHTIKKVLQKLLGIHTYLVVFSLFVMLKLRWDRNEKDFLTFLKLVPDQGNILDIGANIGVMTRFFSKYKKKATIFSFEPIPFNYKVLKRIIRLLGLKNVKTFPVAVGEKEHEIEMIIPKERSVTMHGLCHVKDINGSDESEGENVKTKMICLDTFDELKNSSSFVSAIKLDVENYECHVLKGAIKIIQNDKPLIYTELWDNENRKLCVEIMEKNQYNTFIFTNHKLVPYLPHKGTGQNFVFLPKDVKLNSSVIA